MTTSVVKQKVSKSIVIIKHIRIQKEFTPEAVFEWDRNTPERRSGPFNPPVSRVFYTFGCPTGVGVNYPQVYLEYCATYEGNSNGYTYVFNVTLFSGAKSCVAGSQYVTGNRYGGQQTGNDCISFIYTTAR